MSKYGDVAVRATALVHDGTFGSPVDAWALAVREAFPDKAASQKKGCPKGAYLGLCAAGVVRGVRPGEYTRSVDNRGYALEALRLLRRDPSLAERGDRDGGAARLWDAVMKGEFKQPNHQLDVVLALWRQGYLAR